MISIDKIENFLQSQGYQIARTNLQGVKLYLKQYDGEVQAVLCTDTVRGNDGLMAAPGQTEALYGREKVTQMWQNVLAVIQRNLAEKFPDCRTNLLALFLADDPAEYKELTSCFSGIWILDKSRELLVIYENQPGDVKGLKKGLEDLCMGNTGESSKSLKERLFYRKDGTKRAVMNTSMVVLNIAVWIVMECFGSTMDGGYIAEHGGLYPPYVWQYGRWYLLLTCTFVHFGLRHLSNNMIGLFFTGNIVEDAVGKIRFLIIYLGSGIGSSALSLYMLTKNDSNTVAAGASGAVFGIAGALLWVVIANRGHFESQRTGGVIFMICFCLYSGITSAGTDNWGHLGGLITGFLLCMILYRGKNNRSGGRAI